MTPDEKEAAAAAKAAEKEAAAARVEVTVEWLGNSRSFSKIDHGDEFMEKAKAFADKFNGTIV